MSSKTVGKRDIFSLRSASMQGVVAIPRDWTDKADPNPFEFLAISPPRLSYAHLQQLADLVAELNQVTNITKGVD